MIVAGNWLLSTSQPAGGRLVQAWRSSSSERLPPASSTLAFSGNELKFSKKIAALNLLVTDFTPARLSVNVTTTV